MSQFETISSPANPRVRATAALRNADARRDTGLTLVDGRRECERAVAAGAEVVELFVAADRLAQPAEDDGGLHGWIEGLGPRAARITALAERPFDRLAFGSRNEGLVAVVRWRAAALDAVAFAADPCS